MQHEGSCTDGSNPDTKNGEVLLELAVSHCFVRSARESSKKHLDRNKLQMQMGIRNSIGGRSLPISKCEESCCRSREPQHSSLGFPPRSLF
ncbi:hypothetical protein Mapa_010993 [Marchantia paleacea]|nr:hypothetical protein Mapa_010993 [Marchantia paleacea]